MAECRGIVAKTASKVSTDLRSWDLFVEEQGQTIGEYPTEAQAVAFAIWLSMRRERVCLAQRVGSGPRLTVCVSVTPCHTTCHHHLHQTHHLNLVAGPAAGT